MSTPNYLILSFDGGGLRGLITALMLRDLENDPQTRDLLARVNLFAGTSTGGIIALALASGTPVETIIGLYRDGGSQIFTPAKPTLGELYQLASEFLPLPKFSGKRLGRREVTNPFRFLDDIVLALKEFVMARYVSDGLRELLTPHLSADKTLADLERKVLVTTLQLSDEQSWVPLLLTNLGGAAEPSSASLVLDAALCTGAAPTYFPPHKHSIYGYCADGGLFANNPSTLALTAACAHDIDLKQIRLLSLGTGSRTAQIPAAAIDSYGPQNYGAFLWMSPAQRRGAPSVPLMNAIMDNAVQSDVAQTRLILGTERYQRGNIILTESISLDDHTPAAIQTMERVAGDYIRSDEWKIRKQHIARWLEDS
ncbi:MAG TPA: patatin-like phospholipase family protein [Roseiflexaceae bacterium]|nr:patatin-like phospholipase family protein [Roseiflexaceae bacterium]